MMAELPAMELPVVLGQEYRVKLGRSFTFPRENAYHTIKYDFKPLSVDLSKPGRLRTEGEEVNMSLPLVQAESADDVAQFRGPRKNCTKECVLFINTQTGEAVLEKISNTVQLKAVRSNRKPTARDRSVSPAPFSQAARARSQLPTGALTQPSVTPPPGGKLVEGGAGGQSGSKGSRKGQAKPRIKVAKVDTGMSKASNLSVPGSSDAKIDKRKKSHKASGANTQSQQQQQLMSNMPFVGMGTSPTPEVSPIHSNNPTPEPPVPKKKIKLDHSSSSNSSSSSSSSSSDSESEGEEAMLPANHMMAHMTQPLTSMPGTMTTASTSSTHQQVVNQAPQLQQQAFVPIAQPYLPPPVPHPQQAALTRTSSGSSSNTSESDSDSSSGSSSSDDSSDSSDQENDIEVASAFGHATDVRQRSMSQLRNDLQLSDSGSDSDT